MNPDALVQELKKATADLDRGRVGAVCDQLEAELHGQAEPFPVRQGRSILSLLRSRRYFDEMCRIGAAFASSGQRDAKIQRLYAQALIDSKRPAVALAFLRDIIDAPDTAPGEVAEAWGLIGRVHKQAYVNDPDAAPERKKQLLGDALEAYDRIYDADPEGSLWHGINVVALLARGERDGIPSPIDKDYRQLAGRLRDAVEEREEDRNATIWDYAVAMEASIALEDAPAAIEWCQRYAELGLKRGEDEFEFGSTLRQLQEVWEATPDDFVGKNIVPVLQGVLIDVGLKDKPGGSVSLKTKGLQQLQSSDSFDRLERVFGKDSYKRIQWIQMLMDRCRGIGLVATRDGTGVGTGFVVNGRSLSPNLDDAWYFLTNSHVITNDEGVLDRAPAHRKPLKPNQAFVTFELLFEQEPRLFGVSEVVWTSPPEELDATLVRFDKPFYEEGVKAYPISEDLTDPSEQPRLYIAGHPGGRSLTVSLHDNHLLEFDERLMHYRTPTDPGSSGSPVFNDQMELVGLHHAGDSKLESLSDPAGTIESNEGIRIHAVMEKL